MTMQRKKLLPGKHHTGGDAVSFFSPPPETGSRIGRILAGRYRLEALLGVGAMGEVFRAHDLRRRQQCAIKLVCPDALLNLRAHRRFLNEAQLIARLFHPNIVEVREFNEDDDGTKFLVLELLEGEDLYGVLSREVRVSPVRACSILRGVGAALQYAHDLGIVHRDIKPNNIYLCQQRTPSGHVIEVVKVLDFGLAKLLDPTSEHSVFPSGAFGATALTQGMIVGTPAYLSPEAANRDSSCVDARSDQWSLAVVAYHMLSGRLPFEDPNPYRLAMQICEMEPQPLQKLVPELPEPMCRAIEIAMSKEPDKRFAKIQDFIRAMDGLPPLVSSRRLSSGSQLRPVQSAPRETEPPALSSSVLATAPPSVPTTMAKESRGIMPPGESPAAHAERAAAAEVLTPTILVPKVEATPPSEPPDVLKTVQYTAAELADLSRIMLQDQSGIPSLVREDGPTKPYAFPPQLTDALVERSIADEQARSAADASPSVVHPSANDEPPRAARIESELLQTRLITKTPSWDSPRVPSPAVSDGAQSTLSGQHIDRDQSELQCQEADSSGKDTQLLSQDGLGLEAAPATTRIQPLSALSVTLPKGNSAASPQLERGRYVSWRLLGLSSFALFLSILSALLLGARLGHLQTKRSQATQTTALQSNF